VSAEDISDAEAILIHGRSRERRSFGVFIREGEYKVSEKEPREG